MRFPGLLERARIVADALSRAGIANLVRNSRHLPSAKFGDVSAVPGALAPPEVTHTKWPSRQHFLAPQAAQAF